MPVISHLGIQAAAFARLTPPVVSFTVSISNLTVTVNCSASYGTSSPIVDSRWTFGDGGTGAGVSVTYAYATAGTYTITYTARQRDGERKSITHSVTVTAAATEVAGTTGGSGVEPTGAGIVGYETLSGSTITSKLNTVSSSQVGFASGTYSFNDFAVYTSTDYGFGMRAGTNVTGILGAGSNYTTFEMTPNTSTRTDVPTTRGSTTNGYSLMSLNTNNATFSGFTLQGTSQQSGQMYYNGLILYETTGANLFDIKIAAIPGYDYVNPGETFGINEYRGTNNTYSHIEIDGANVGASAFATNYCTNPTYSYCYAHDNPYSGGCALYMTANSTWNYFKSINNRHTLNIEMCTGTHTFNTPTLGKGTADSELYIGSDTASSVVNINDPVLSGISKIRINVPASYGNGQVQSPSDIHVYQNGTDVTSTLVTWVGLHP